MKYGSRDIFNSVFRGFKWDETCTGGDCVTDSPPAGCVIGAIHHCVKRGRPPLNGGIVDADGVLIIIREDAAVDSYRITSELQDSMRVKCGQRFIPSDGTRELNWFLQLQLDFSTWREDNWNRLQRQPSISCFCVNVSAVNTGFQNRRGKSASLSEQYIIDYY